MKLRKLLVTGLVATSMTITGAAFAQSSESADDPATEEVEPSNELTCGNDAGTSAAGAPIEVGVASRDGGAGGELCSTGGPIEGRVILQGEDDANGGYLAVDGDESNREHHDALTGYVKVNQDGTFGCGEGEGDTDATTGAGAGACGD